MNSIPMTSIRSRLVAGSAFALLLLPALMTACESTSAAERDAAAFIADMDSRPADERVANWDETKKRMLRGAPAVGDVAPDFELETREGDGTIRLSEFQPTKPVVLIFGSWT